MLPVLRLSLLVSLAGCVQLGGGQDGGACAEIACGPSYQIAFTRQGAWTAGNYRVEVTADGVGTSCDIVIPMTCDLPPRCQGSPAWVPMVEGCALDPSQQRIGGITFNHAMPSRVTVAVSQGDRGLGMVTFMPSYRTSAGPAGCNLSCTQAPGDTLPLAQ